MPADHVLTLPLLYVRHVLMGLAAGGIGLATGSLVLKLAPPAHATSFLAAVSLTGSEYWVERWPIGSRFGKFLWSCTGRRQRTSGKSPWCSCSTGVSFAISAVLRLYVMHALSKIAEDGESSYRMVIQQFVLKAMRSLDQLSFVEALGLATLFPFGRLIERRRQAPD